VTRRAKCQALARQQTYLPGHPSSLVPSVRKGFAVMYFFQSKVKKIHPVDAVKMYTTRTLLLKQ
jgi:hypothetical protein